jgi:hypothetical protein
MFQVTSGGSNTTAIVNLTVTGTTGGTLTYSYATVTGVTLANAPLNVEFTPCMPASAPNTAIAVSLPRQYQCSGQCRRIHAAVALNSDERG